MCAFMFDFHSFVKTVKSIDGLPDGKISKAFIIPLIAPFQLNVPPSLSGKPMKSSDKTSFVFSAEMPGGCFRVLGTKCSFQTWWFQFFLSFFLFFFEHIKTLTLNNMLCCSNSPATNSFCRTALARPNWKRYK